MNKELKRIIAVSSLFYVNHLEEDHVFSGKDISLKSKSTASLIGKYLESESGQKHLKRVIKSDGYFD